VGYLIILLTEHAGQKAFCKVSTNLLHLMQELQGFYAAQWWMQAAFKSSQGAGETQSGFRRQLVASLMVLIYCLVIMG